MVTYSKLRSGSWGVRGPADLVQEGRTVTVEKRDGSRKLEHVVKIVWTDGAVALAAITERATASASAGRAPSPAPRRRRGGGCHTDGNCSSCCNPQTCPCGDGGWFRCC